MLKISITIDDATVALRKESVDRNNTRSQILIDVLQSLSARRAWIEIECVGVLGCKPSGRSPQGERG